MDVSGLFQDLQREGWAVREQFLATSDVIALRGEVEQLERLHAFRRCITAIRQCRAAAIGKHTPEASRVAGRILADLQRARRADSPGKVYGYFSRYDAGDYFRRHVDCDRFALPRFVLNLYLNNGWTEPDGGAFRIYTRSGAVDVRPRAGTVTATVNDTWHEVLPARRTRYALSFACDWSLYSDRLCREHQQRHRLPLSWRVP